MRLESEPSESTTDWSCIRFRICGTEVVYVNIPQRICVYRSGIHLQTYLFICCSTQNYFLSFIFISQLKPLLFPYFVGILFVDFFFPCSTFCVFHGHVISCPQSLLIGDCQKLTLVYTEESFLLKLASPIVKEPCSTNASFQACASFILKTMCFIVLEKQSCLQLL